MPNTLLLNLTLTIIIRTMPAIYAGIRIITPIDVSSKIDSSPIPVVPNIHMIRLNKIEIPNVRQSEMMHMMLAFFLSCLVNSGLPLA